MVRLRDILGVGGVPCHFTSARDWCDRKGVARCLVVGIGGKNWEIDEHTLPLATREAVMARVGVSAPIEMGEIDPELQAFAGGKSKAIQQEGRADAALLLVFHCAFVETGSKAKAYKALEAHCAARDIHCPSEVTLRRWRAQTAGVSAINWPFALCRDTAPGAAKANGTEQFWSVFDAVYTESHSKVRIKSCWRDAKEYCEAKGLKCPSLSTTRAHWKSRPYGERKFRQLGAEAGQRANNQHITTDKSCKRSMEKLTLDARMCDVEVIYEDGTKGRPWIVAYVDEASTKTVGWKFAKSENAETTAELTLEVCKAHGIPDLVKPDNGAAFCSKLLSGRTKHKFRGASDRDPTLEPLGIWERLGVEVSYCKPGNPRGKTVESAFRTMSVGIDKSWIFKDAYTGPDTNDKPKVPRVPMPNAEFEKKYSREIRRMNAEPGRKGQNTKGASYDTAFEACKRDRLFRQITIPELEACKRVWASRSVTSNGQVKILGGSYGKPCTWDELMPFHERGERVFVGIDPKDHSRPALIEDKNGIIISDCVLIDVPTTHGTKAGAEEAGRRTKEANKHAHVLSARQQAIRKEILADVLAVRAAKFDVEPETPPVTVVRPNFPKPPKRAPVPDDDDWNPDFAANEQRRRQELRAAKRA